MKAHEETAEAREGVVEAFGLKLFVNTESIKNYIHLDILKTNLSSLLPQFFNPLADLSNLCISTRLIYKLKAKLTNYLRTRIPSNFLIFWRNSVIL